MKYIVTVPYFASTTVVVEADSKKEALDKATRDVHVSVCAQCSKDLDLGDPDINSMIEDDVEEYDD